MKTEKTCTRCNEAKPISEFYKNGDGYRSRCIPCFQIVTAERVADHRRKTKVRLVAYFGGKCLDCGITGPPYIFDFDHRDPSKKKFGVMDGATRSWEKTLTEAKKCDLVCAVCHRHRTHIQRCDGCEYCSEESDRAYATMPVNRSFKKVAEGSRLIMPDKFCPCGKKINFLAKRCAPCYNKSKRKFDPPLDEVINKVKEKGFLQTGKDYGVSDNGIRKFLRRHGVDPKSVR